MKTLDQLTEPLAIAMWDSSWIRRRYRGGGFEDWDKALREFTERGYNAVRIDVFPHLIAPSPVDGKVVEVFKDVPNQFPHFFGFAAWGNQWTQYINPRKSLIDFLTRCREYGVKANLTTWFKPTDDYRNEQIEGVDEFVTVWDETLRFIDANGLMDTVVCLDVLNEYPAGHCFAWFHRMRGMSKRVGPGGVNEHEEQFIWDFLSEAIGKLREKWPHLSIAASFPGLGRAYSAAKRGVLAEMDFLDPHTWIVQNGSFNEGLEYFDTICEYGNPHKLFTVERKGGSYSGMGERIIPADYRYDEVYAAMLAKWRDHLPEWTAWYAQLIGEMAELADQNGCHLGQTEGWAMYNWAEHPLLGWDIFRESAEICAQICAEKGFLFNCTSNFCHPHFYGFWDDPQWHQRVTSQIRSGKLRKVGQS